VMSGFRVAPGQAMISRKPLQFLGSHKFRPAVLAFDLFPGLAGILIGTWSSSG
jgi:hypothetical protein